MNSTLKRLTAAQEILLAAHTLSKQKKLEFSEWDLTIASWKKNPNRFGCRGYEDKYPDHKRVMMEIMGTTKKDNPIRRGLIQKTRPNYYALTALGAAEAEVLQANAGSIQPAVRSVQPIYDSVHPYVSHSVFRKFVGDENEPRTWLAAAAFLALQTNNAHEVDDKIRSVRAAVAAAITWLDESGQAHLRRGVTGGGNLIARSELTKLEELVAVIEQRFSVQINAIRGGKT